MVYRNIFGSRLKITHRITARSHYVAQKLVCFSNSASGTIDEVSLNHCPLLVKSCAIGRRQCAQVEGLHTFGPLFENSLGAGSIAALDDSSVVLIIAKS